MHWVALRYITSGKTGILERQNTRFIESPRSIGVVGVSETQMIALVMGKIQIIIAQWFNNPIGHPDQGGFIEITVAIASSNLG